MKYSHILGYVANAIWAIDEDKMHELMAVLAFRAAGHSFTPDEIKARIGNADAATAQTRQGTAVVPIRGIIANRMGSMDDSSGGTSCERIAAMIDRCMAENVSAIVYDFDTPGGTVQGVQELADKMYGLRGAVKQVAMVNGMAASAGYWLAAMCDEIVCTPSGVAGSIGVFTVMKDMTDALAKEGIKVEVIRAGKYKAEDSGVEPISEEAREFKTVQVNNAYAQFAKDVARGRGVSMSDVRSGYGQGRALTGKDALAAGLIDRIGTMDETLARMSSHQGRSRIGMRALSASDALAAADDIDILELNLLAKAVANKENKAMQAAAKSELRAAVQVLVCDCSTDCPCQNGGVCGENCGTCVSTCSCVASETPETTPATPVPMPTPASSPASGSQEGALFRRLL